MAEDPLRSSLVEMGFDAKEVDAALAATGNSSVEAAMQWIVERQEAGLDTSKEPEETTETEDVVKEKQPLTEEERKLKTQELEKLRLKKRAEREEMEKKANEERERRRIREGKTLSQIKRDMEDKELRKAAEERRREKRETQLAKERVKAQIEADKLARKRNQQDSTTSAPQPSNTTPTTVHDSSVAKKAYENARLQIRLPDGSALVHTFSAKETLAAVRLYVRLNRRDVTHGPETAENPNLPLLMTSFPKKVFNDAEYECPLEALGLVPSAVLIVKE